MSTKAKSEKVAGKVLRRRPGAERSADSAEVEVLRVVAETRILTVDQLARFLGVAPDVAGRRAAQAVELGWAEIGTFRGFPGEWVWLRNGGYRRAGSGFHHRTVLTGQLDHVHAITEARLALREEFPQGEWVSERELWRRGRGAGLVPDGLLGLPGRRVAVEVEMSRKRIPELRRMMVARCEAFDEVIYFAAPRARAQLEAARAELGAEKVSVRPIAGARRSTFVGPLDKRLFEPEPEEQVAMRMISEEGLVAADQLGPLLGESEEVGLELGLRLVQRNFARREFEVDGDGGWLRLTRRANGLSGTGLGAFEPTTAVGLEHRAALARIRVGWCARAGRHGWLTRRMLVSGLPGPRRADVPSAVAESRQGRFAVMPVGRGVAVGRRRRDLAVFSTAFDGVLCFADPDTIGWVRDHVAGADLENVEIAPIP